MRERVKEKDCFFTIKTWLKFERNYQSQGCDDVWEDKYVGLCDYRFYSHFKGELAGLFGKSNTVTDTFLL